MTATEPATTRVNTTRFGVVEADEEIIIELPDGLIGFEDCHRFVVVNLEQTAPIAWLQSLDDGAVAFPIIDPWLVVPKYSPVVCDFDAGVLGLSEDAPKLVYCVVTIPRGGASMTMNLLGPIVINPLSRKGKQVIVLNDQYAVRHPINPSEIAH